MNPPDKPCQATPAGDLRQQIMDSRVPKNEREWWAGREIEKLERELTAANKGWQLSSQSNELCLRELYKVRDELAAEQAERERLNDGLKMAEAMVRATTDRSDTFRAELTRLRAEVERLKAPRSLFVSASIYEDALARAEKAEAECVRLKSLGSWAHTCVHHNDAERKAAMCCPVCEQTRSQKIETALKDAISTYFGDDKLVTAERIEAWQAALKDNK
jgi:hypothetical protein